MSPLGRGLASLIPRKTEEVEAVEEQDLFQQLEADDEDMDSDAFFAQADGGEAVNEKVEVTMDEEEQEQAQPVEVEEESMPFGSEPTEKMEAGEPVSPLAFSVQGQSERQESEDKEETAEDAGDDLLFMIDDGDDEGEENEGADLPGADEQPMAQSKTVMSKPKIFVSENRSSLLAHEAIVARQAKEDEKAVKDDVIAQNQDEVAGVEEEILTEEVVEESESDTPEPLTENPVVPEEDTPDVSETGEDDVDGGEPWSDSPGMAQRKEDRVSIVASAAKKQPKVEEVAREAVVASESKTVDDDVVAPAFGEVGAADVWNQHEEKISHVAIGDIRINPLQPRRQFVEEDLDELRDSIDKHGILQPLVIRRLAEGEGFELIAGERRLRAAKSLNWSKVPCVVRKDVKSDQSRLVYALIENIQRSNLNPVEEALAYQQLNTEYGLTHEEVGERVGKSRVAITNAVRVLQLPAEIQRGLAEKKITIGHAKAILMIPDEEKQVRFYRHLVEEGVTVRKAEIRARRIQRAMKVNDPTRVKNRGQHPLAIRYTPPLESRYGYGAKIKYNEEKNRFNVTFEAYSEKDLDELVGRLMGANELPEHDRDIIGEEEA